MNILNKEAVVSLTPQSEVSRWLLDRRGLITGTKYWGIYFSKTEEEKINHAKKICGILSDSIPDEAKHLVNYGINNESKLRDFLEQYLAMKIYEVGVIKMSEDSIFACSVDGILENGDIVEFKTTQKETPTQSASDNSEIPINYRWQMNHNMAVTGAQYCHYLSYSHSSNLLYYKKIKFDSELWELEMKPKAIEFYLNFIKPVKDSIS